ncbi:nucleotide sugar dehydrogenase [Erysipelothrix sp. HDW6A]|uniref:nucleotide sugar dehydrogenase n=1 Tax=Erysipelothrix sp. HDW6A TaxID=2714928 RepID=UPI00140C3192|nr:nucleotide sugar dehydrogenase [Erysipelothrix sp. HDW6A]QIK56977.1 nucleotide sugar dehydrogenase [Erysipelothrix sp. HDW6A]
MKINVIGLGYIGLPTSLILAANGNTVVGTDTNQEIVNKLNNNIVTFEEGGLGDLFLEASKSGFTAETHPVKADMYIITVPTPYMKESKLIDPKYVQSAVRQVLEVMNAGAILVIESTVSPGTIDKYIRPIVLESNKSPELVHAPERILPGAMISELINNSRTIGADSQEVAEKVKRVYETFCKGEIVLTDIRTAEMSKVVENTYRDINIAFANELAQVCREAGLDVYEVIRIANKHPRVNILQPGPGVGGHCISVDPWFLVGDYPESTKLIHQARRTNDSMPNYVFDRIVEIMKENNITEFSKVGIYGLTYKENVDDMRESPTLQLLENIPQSKEFIIYDPLIIEKKIANQELDFSNFIKSVELVVIMVNHDQLKNQSLEGKVVFDTKNSITLPNTYKL